MAKSRYGKKKGKKKAGTHRSKRSAAGRKAWRTKVKRYGHAGAVARMFGGKGKSKRRPVVGKGKRGKRAGKRRVSHRSGGSYSEILRAIKLAEGTSGQPVSASEKAQANQAFYAVHQKGAKVSAEDAAKRRIASETERLKMSAAARILEIEHRERAAQEARDKAEQRKAELRARAARL